MVECPDPVRRHPLRDAEPAVFAGAPWRRWVLPVAVLLVLALAGGWGWLLASGLDPAGAAGPGLLHRLPLMTLVHHVRGAGRA